MGTVSALVSRRIELDRPGGNGPGAEALAAADVAGGAPGSTSLMVIDPLPLLATLGTLALGCAALGIGILVILATRTSAANAEPPAGSIDAWRSLEANGLLAVGLVTQTAELWVPAGVIRLACNGSVVVVDGRTTLDVDYDDPGSPDIRLEFVALPTGSGDATDGEAWLIRGLFGSDPRPGAQVTAVRLGELADRLARAVGVAIYAIRPRYITESRLGWMAMLACFVSGGAVIFGLLSAQLGRYVDFPISGAAVVLGIAGMIMGYRMAKAASPLTVDGAVLAADAERVTMQLQRPMFSSVADGERLLPWSILFGEPATAQRMAWLALAGNDVPAWYRFDGEFSKARFTTCMDELTSGLRAPAEFVPTRPW